MRRLIRRFLGIGNEFPAYVVGPNDVIIVTCPGAISDKIAAEIRTKLETRLGLQVMVLSEGLDVKVLKRVA